MKKLALTLTALPAALMGSLSAAPAPAADQPSKAWRSKNQDVILEAVVRHQISTQAQRFPDTTCFCIAVKSSARSQPAAPSPAFLRRFARHPTPVRPPTACRLEGTRSVAQPSSSPAISVTAGPIYWDAAEHVSVDTAFYRDSESEGADSYTLALRKQGWAIVATAHRWVTPASERPGAKPAGEIK